MIYLLTNNPFPRNISYMNITPDSIPFDATPIDGDSVIPAPPPFPPHLIKGHNEQNVYVEFVDGSTEVGRLNTDSNGETFTIGHKSHVRKYADIKTFRLV